MTIGQMRISDRKEGHREKVGHRVICFEVRCLYKRGIEEEYCAEGSAGA